MTKKNRTDKQDGHDAGQPLLFYASAEGMVVLG
jgi:hypothetical protein